LLWRPGIWLRMRLPSRRILPMHMYPRRTMRTRRLQVCSRRLRCQRRYPRVFLWLLLLGLMKSFTMSASHSAWWTSFSSRRLLKTSLGKFRVSISQSIKMLTLHYREKEVKNLIQWITEFYITVFCVICFYCFFFK
jgi:hypothetical protein